MENASGQEKKERIYPSLIEDSKLEPYLIAYDKKSYIILERGIKEKKDGTKEEVLREKCYPTSFSRALEYVVREKVHSKNYSSLEDALTTYRKIQEDLVSTITI